MLSIPPSAAAGPSRSKLAIASCSSCVRHLHTPPPRRHDSRQLDRAAQDDSDFLLSLLEAGPSIRDSRKYLRAFNAEPKNKGKGKNALVDDLLSHTVRRPALVKIQGPFTDVQLDSVSRGMAYLQKLGLVPIVLLDRDDDGWHANGRKAATRELERTCAFLARHRAVARPILATVARARQRDGSIHIEDEGLEHIRRAVAAGEIPVLIPLAVDEVCRSEMVPCNSVIQALARAMGEHPDLTPLRLLIINREGGVPSYARNGLPHLSINLASEHDFIAQTFRPRWRDTHPTALSNLALANDCLDIMPSHGSALIVSHRSPAALIANLITNKPAFSASLPHSLLSEGRITPHTPTLIRKGLPIKVIRSMADVDRAKLTSLLERSFNRVLDQDSFYARLESHLDFLIVAGDYAGAALCTHERPKLPDIDQSTICYLDKFAVLPAHQGDGTVDFLWVALRDETFGLGLTDAANANVGSLSGVGRGRDLVWRSRADNPVNKWYYERSNGFVTRGKWKLFWCDAEERMRRMAEQQQQRQGESGVAPIVASDEHGRIDFWGDVVEAIPSAWSD